jgi:nucleoid DNA-binding protein
MTKAELIKEVAKEAQITKWAAEAAINRTRDAIVKETADKAGWPCRWWVRSPWS